MFVHEMTPSVNICCQNFSALTNAPSVNFTFPAFTWSTHASPSMRPVMVEKRQDWAGHPSPSGRIRVWMPFTRSFTTMAFMSA